VGVAVVKGHCQGTGGFGCSLHAQSE
jgi:hypothetical protein